jgi:hypothetical protein
LTVQQVILLTGMRRKTGDSVNFRLTARCIGGQAAAEAKATWRRAPRTAAIIRPVPPAGSPPITRLDAASAAFRENLELRVR